MTGLVTAWLTEVVLISYRATKKGTNEGTANVPLPRPSQYASTFVIFGVLGLVPKQAANVASLFGWGIVVATFLNLWNPVDAKTGTTSVTQSGQKNAVGNVAA